MFSGSRWLRYLWIERKSLVIPQFFRMARLHSTPFMDLLENILVTVEDFEAGFTFPTVASVALRHPELAVLAKSFRQEISSHGFKHINYKYLPAKDQKLDILKSISSFKRMGVKVQGFRAPYNIYAKETPLLLQEFNLKWDGGLGFGGEYQKHTSFFRIKLNTSKSNYFCIPLSRWSDDRMIEYYGLSNNEICKILVRVMEKVRKRRGVVMFDLHPIRIGQSKYVGILKHILKEGGKLEGWFPTVTEAVEYWATHKNWKNDASFCCLLTGDIDNFTFKEYLTRLF